MNIGTFYPKKIGNTAGWSTSLSNPAASGDFVFINDSNDSTYLKKNSESSDKLYIYFNEPSISNYFSTIDSAILRVRAKLDVDSVPANHGIFGNNVYGFNTQHEPVEITNILDTATALVNKSSSVVPLIVAYPVGDSSSAYYEYLGGTQISGTSYITYDFELTLNENDRHETFCINHFKDSKIEITGPSGLYIADVSLILTGDMSDGLMFNTLGGECKVRREQITGQHVSNLRYWCRDSDPHPTGFFSYYMNFKNNSPITSLGFFSSNDYDGSKPLTVYNVNTNPLPYINDSGYPVNYEGAVIINGSGLYPGLSRINDSTNIIRDNRAWTYYFSIKPESINDINDSYRLLMRYGGSTGWPSENFTFRIRPKDGGHYLDYDYLEFNYYDGSQVYKSKNLFSNNFKPFHNSEEASKIIVTYSGDRLYRNDGGLSASGTMKFYVASKECVDINQSTHFRYLGEVSDSFYVYDRAYESNVSLFGSPQYGGGLLSTESDTASIIVNEIGVKSNAYYSGIKVVNGNQYLDSTELNNLIEKRKNADSYIENSGDGRYVEIKLRDLISNNIADSGKKTEIVTFICKSGQSGKLEILAPFTTADGYLNIMENTARVEYSIQVDTNHPSGVDAFFTLEGDYDGMFGISFNTVLNSGLNTGILYNPKVFGLDSPKRIVNSDIHRFNFNIGFTTHPVYNERYDSTIKVDSAKLFIDVVNIATTGTNNLPFFIDSEGGFEHVDLFIAGQDQFINDVDIFIKGNDFQASGTTLYIKSGLPAESGMSFYTDGIGIEAKDIPMYMQGTVGVSDSGMFNMYSLGAINPSYTNDIMLYLNSADTYRDRVLPLSIHGKSINVDGNITLYLKNDNQLDKEFPLYLAAPSGINDDVTFYINAPGSTSGSVPLNGNICLYMSRNGNDSTDDRFKLFIGGPNEVIAETPFYIAGAHIANSSISFYTKGSPIQENTNLKIYTHGF